MSLFSWQLSNKTAKRLDSSPFPFQRIMFQFLQQQKNKKQTKNRLSRLICQMDIFLLRLNSKNVTLSLFQQTVDCKLKKESHSLDVSSEEKK